jgi:tetratricopeptide (TPR) repeat protein
MARRPLPVKVLLAAIFSMACSLSITAAEPTAPRTIDLTELCLKLAPVQEPEVDVEKLRAGLKALEARARKALRDAKTPAEKIAALNKVLLGNRKVSYISNRYWRDSTLASSVLRGRGNCLSTTTLYVVIGQRLKLPIRAVPVPLHILARYDDGKTRINIETTAGGRPQPDERYRDRHGWTDADARVLRLGRSLTDRQFGACLYEYAAKHFQSVRKYKKALENADRALELWPNNPDLQLLRFGMLYEVPERRKQALAGYLKILRASRSPGVRTAALLALAGDFQVRGKHEAALGLLRSAYRSAPRFRQPAIFSSMASSYRTLRRFDEAALAMELATIKGGQAQDYTGLAIFYKNAGKLEDAIRCLRVSLRMNPENWNTRLILAGYLIRAGKKDAGWKTFAMVRKPRVNLQFFHNNMAWFYGSVGKKKEFLEHLGKALELARTPAILNYINTEVDFDRYRKDEDFKALLEKYRRKLAPEKRTAVPR